MPKSFSRGAPHPRPLLLFLVALVALVALAVSCRVPAPPPHADRADRTHRTQPHDRTAAPRMNPELAFTISEGGTENRFLRDGRVAAHLLTTSGPAPRVVVAFPAGNMGVGLWFGGAADLEVQGALTPVERSDGMRGISVTLHARVSALRITRALLGSVRILRSASHGDTLPEGMAHTTSAGPPAVLRRTTLDGRHHLELSLEPKHGAATRLEPNGDLTLLAGPSGDLVVAMTALTDEEPLTPVAQSDILQPGVRADARALEVLAFLTYEEKLLAGSWQYLTYFGRDTLLSTRLLLPVLRPVVIEAALGAVIERLTLDGDVAHEEDIGEWAAIENRAHTPRPADLRQPIYDYKMVDDDYLLAPVLAAYVLDHPDGPARARDFFARRTTGGRTYAAAVAQNLARVLAHAAPFGARPSRETLVRIHDGLHVGNWRDSYDGLGKGRVPYDVNAALVPAALRAAERLYATDAFQRDRLAAARAAELAAVWLKAEPLFRVDLDAEQARARVRAYAAEQGLDARDALAAITGPVSFPALALDARGEPVPVLHSDEGFVLLFTEPSSAWLTAAAKRSLLPFPAGLRTPVGILVANPAYAQDSALRALFTRDHYHGTVVWSWQQAMLLAGLRRQLARHDLTLPARNALLDAERSLRAVLDATKTMRTSELWSFAADKNGYRVVPFGQAKGHHTEANAAQLWSTVYLALD